MTRRHVPAVAGALMLSASALAAPAAAPPPAPPPNEGPAHAAVSLAPNAKMMVLKGPAMVTHVVTAGTGSAQLFEVATKNASNAGCVANPVAGTMAVTLANASTQELRREIPAGHLLCATLTAGSAMSLTWYGTEQASAGPGGGTSVTVNANQPRFMFAGPATIVHTATGGDAQLTIYTMNTSSGSDADCVPPAPPPPAGSKAGTPPPAAPATAPGALPAGGALLKKLGLRQSEKQNIVVPAGRSACAEASGGAEGKVDWKLK